MNNRIEKAKMTKTELKIVEIRKKQKTALKAQLPCFLIGMALMIFGFIGIIDIDLPMNASILSLSIFIGGYIVVAFFLLHPAAFPAQLKCVQHIRALKRRAKNEMRHSQKPEEFLRIGTLK